MEILPTTKCNTGVSRHTVKIKGMVYSLQNIWLWQVAKTFVGGGKRKKRERENWSCIATDTETNFAFRTKLLQGNIKKLTYRCHYSDFMRSK